MRISDWSSDVGSSDLPGVGPIEASMVDAANSGVFVMADRLGLTGTEMPADLDARPDLMEKLEANRCAAAVAMGMRSEERRVGQEGVSTCSSWWSPAT